MSDKKKCFYRNNTNRRKPMDYAKLEREYFDNMDMSKNKDLVGEKTAQRSEKELSSGKTPTILIKARDDTQRALSPKRGQTKRTDVESTSKQNVGTESANSLSCPNKMISSVKLIDENLEFNVQALEHLIESQNDYLVVGVLGGQGVGKSTIINLIAHNKYNYLSARVLNKPLNKHDSNKIEENGLDSKSSSDLYSEYSSSDIQSQNSENSLEKKDSFDYIVRDLSEKMKKDFNICSELDTHSSTNFEDFFKFKIQSQEQIQMGQHCTKGVDMYVTTNRIILLDCQPVLSASIMDKMITMDTKVIPTESAIELESLHLASFLLSTCHIVIIVQDWFMDHNLIRFIQTAEMLKPTTISNNDEITPEHYPHVMFLQNRATMSDFLPENIELMKHMYLHCFKHSKLQIQSGMGIKSQGYKENNTDTNTKVNMYIFPEVLHDYDNEAVYHGHDSLENLVADLRLRILGVTQTPVGPSVTSEKHWGQFASKTWDAINKNGYFGEYTRLLP